MDKAHYSMRFCSKLVSMDGRILIFCQIPDSDIR